MKKQKKVMAIHDLSGVGRSSLGVIIPTLSAMNVQVCSVPTAVLSTHTGGFGSPATVDLTDYMNSALEHYKGLGLEIDSVYTGFLGNEAQIDICKKYFQLYPKSLKLVDPVMGDDGKAYTTIDEKIQKKMKELVAEADVITPNLTEAAILLGQPYQSNPDLESCKRMLEALGEIGARVVILKGLSFAEGEISNLLYHRENNEIYRVDSRRTPQFYPGTGDIFASVYLGAFLMGATMEEALEKSSRFLEYAVDYSYKQKTQTKYGILLEDCLGWFYNQQ